jgi:hypothetical protein
VNAAFLFVLAVLATFRVAHLLVREDGPFAILARLRSWLRRHRLSGALDCLACASVWVALPLTYLVWRALPIQAGVPEGLMTWFAVSGGACLLDRLGTVPLLTEPLPDAEAHRETEDAVTTERRP